MPQTLAYQVMEDGFGVLRRIVEDGNKKAARFWPAALRFICGRGEVKSSADLES